MSDTEDNLPKPEGSGEDFRNDADNDHSQNGDRHEDRMEEEGDKEDNNRDRDDGDRSEGGENNERSKPLESFFVGLIMNRRERTKR